MVFQTLEDQLRKAKAGGQIDESDIPPAVATGTYHSKPTPPPAHDSGSSSPPPVYTPPEATRPAPVPAHRPSPRPAPAQIHGNITCFVDGKTLLNLFTTVFFFPV